MYDVVIVGGGITGPALAYVLARYTNARRVALLEKEGGAARVNSGHEANSQTLHRGDIETNFAPEKAVKVRDAAEYVAAFLERHGGQGIFVKTQKMVIAVGADEVVRLHARFEAIRQYYPELRLIEREEIAQLEPKVMEGRDPAEPIVALLSPDGYIVNYGRLAEAFIRESGEGARLDVHFRTQAKRIQRVDGVFVVETDRGTFRAKAIAVTAGAHSLIFAKQLGYGRELEILPVAGSFYRTRIRNCLKGKVYTMQIEGIPFAAPHGDPEVTNPHETRFGPTAKMVPMLERRRYSTVLDFFRSLVWSWRGLLAFLAVLSDPKIRWFALRNLFLDLPVLGKWMYLQDIRKIIPSMRYRDLEFAHGIGGIRPQVVDTRTGKMVMGEGKVVGDGCIFDVTPSPGATNCLGNAVNDATKLIEFLGPGYTFDRERFIRDHTRAKLEAVQPTAVL